MRRFLIALGVAVAVISSPASGVAGAAPPPPPPPVAVEIAPTPYGCYFRSNPTWIAIGQEVRWINETTSARTVTQREGVWIFTVPYSGSVSRTMHSAGLFYERCDDGGYDNGIPVGPSAPGKTSNPTFTVTWADSSAPSTNLYTVQYRIGKTGEWKAWKTRVPGRAATFNGLHNRTYQFHALTRTSSTAYTPFGPAKTVIVR